MRAILTNVLAFVEQPGRRVIQQKRNSLDTLDAIFIGPTSQELNNMPAWGSRHRSFPFMTCETAEVTSREGGLSEIHAHYVGKIFSNTSVIVTTPVISTSWHEQSLSWTTNTAKVDHVISPAVYAPAIDIHRFPDHLLTPAVHTLGYLMISYAMRYTSKAVTFKYLTNVRPVTGDAFNGTFAAAATGFLGLRNYDVQAMASSVTLDPAQALIAEPIQLDSLTDVQVNDLDNGWFECSEVYMRRFVIDVTLPRLAR